MKIERTHDMSVVKSILDHPRIAKHICEDGVLNYDPIDHEGFYWMLITDNDVVSGVFLLHALNSSCIEMHTCLLPEIWGAKADQAAKLLGDYVFYELKYKKLVTNVPKYNVLALRYATKNGMTKEGINRSSFMNNGELIDQIFLGVTLKEWEICQPQSLSQQQP